MSQEAWDGYDGLLSRLSVVLVRPREASNVGSIARLMANFGVRQCVLLAPRCDSNSAEARENATGSGAVTLATMRVVKNMKELAHDNHVFIAVNGSRSSEALPILSPEDLRAQLRTGSVSLVFGPEETGLADIDLGYCSHAINIPMSNAATNLNLSHAVAIILSRVFAAIN